MSKKGPRIQIGARLPTDLVEQLYESARRNGRTISAETELAIREYLETDTEGALPPELIQIIENWYKKKEASGSR